ncbi:hypothetical protein Tco_1314566 [Tanacetum coccineum]
MLTSTGAMTFSFIQAIEHGNASTYGALLGSMRNAIRSAKCDMGAGGGAITSLLSMLLTWGSLTGGLGGGRFGQLYYMFSSDVELSKFPSSSIGTIQEAYDVLLKQANNKTVPTSPKRRPVCRHMATLQIPQSGAFFSALDSSRSSPSRSPMRASGPDPTLNYGFWAGRPYADACFLGSGQYSSPGSGHNSGHNSFGGDMSSAQLFWQHSRLPFDDRKLDTAVVDPLAAEEGPVAKRPHKDLGLSSEENVVTDSSLAKNVEEGPVPKCPRKDLVVKYNMLNGARSKPTYKIVVPYDTLSEDATQMKSLLDELVVLKLNGGLEQQWDALVQSM